jgi:hypothetical protein
LWIELLYLEDCPGFARTLSTIEEVVAEEGIAAETVPR